MASDTGLARPASMCHARTSWTGPPGRFPPPSLVVAGEQAPIATTLGLSIVTSRMPGSSGPSAWTALAGIQLRTVQLPRWSSDTSCHAADEQAIWSGARDGAGNGVASSATGAAANVGGTFVGRGGAGGASPHGRRIATPITPAAAITTGPTARRPRAGGGGGTEGG